MAFDFVFGAWVDGLLAERLPTQNTGAFFEGVWGVYFNGRVHALVVAPDLDKLAEIPAASHGKCFMCVNVWLLVFNWQAGVQSFVAEAKQRLAEIAAYLGK